ncbi:MAG: hypothetical protein E7662_09440 [Ruminococcaceae bacterium]|nr:hypothetical protein [Oscillospiraceae bacterium]
MKKFASALLALLMLAPALAACSDEPAPVTDDTSAAEMTAPSENAPSETGRADVKDNIPADFNLSGKSVGLLVRAGQRKLDFDGGGEETGDVIYDAVYYRTRTVEERLGFTFDLTEGVNKWQDFGKELEQNIMAGDDRWQIVITPANATMGSGRDFLFQDLSENKYIDLDQPWWWKKPTTEISLDGKKIRYLVGDICLTCNTTAGAMYFNTNLLTNAGYNTDELYQSVIDRKWTYDKLHEMSASLYKDVNGNGKVDDGDIYGMMTMSKETIRHMEFTGNIRHYSRDENGYPYLDYDQERSVKMIDTLNKLLYETKGNEYREGDTVYTIFTGGTAAFFPGRLNYALNTNFREMKDNYGIIPYPMLDLEQGEYTNLIHGSNNYATVPITCKTPDESGAVIEAMCAESYRTVVELFYETALKSKYSRDSYSGQCIDIILATSEKYFINEYNNVVKGGLMITDQVSKNQNNFASAYAAQKAVTDQKIKDLIAANLKADNDRKG